MQTSRNWLGTGLLMAGMAGQCAQASQEGVPWLPQAVTTPSLSATGYRFRPRQVDTPTLSATGYRHRPRQVVTPGLSATGYRGDAPATRRQYDLMRVVPLDGGTNPFDYEDVRRDIQAALTPGVIGGGDVGGAPIPLLPGLTFFGEGFPAYIKIDANGPNSLDTFLAGPDTATALIFNVSMDASTGRFDAGPSWQIVTRSHANPVNETVQSAFVMRRLAGGNYYQVKVWFSNTGGLTYSIDDLSGFNCGASIASCPP